MQPRAGLDHVAAEYDVIIVGSGSAGATLAGRLSEDADRSVLLIEAGPSDRSLAIDMPGAAYMNFMSPRYNWMDHTVPQMELGGRKAFAASGRVLGGSSSINTMVYMRGHPSDFDGWEASGAKGWSHAAVLPYFKRSETYDDVGDTRYRGTTGPLRTSKATIHGPLQEGFLEAGQQAGFLFTPDPNGAQQEGFYVADQTISSGRRSSARRAYLSPAEGRSNLTIALRSHVVAVTLARQTATGVRVRSGGKERQIRARKEVVLSAGAARSPQILMLSGIGPADSLKAHDIGVVHHLPGVGGNLQEHIEIQLVFRCKEPVSHSRYMRPDRQMLAGLQWLAFKTGPCASTGFDVGAVLKTDSALPAPDTEVYLYPALLDGATPKRGQHGFGIAVGLTRARSRGHVRLGSSDPLAPPLIDPCYLSEPSDLAGLKRCVEMAREIAAAPALNRHVSGTIDAPASNTAPDVEAWIRQTMIGVWHLVGTCRMGSGADAVTDQEGRVHGIERLRVVDGSLMPKITNANLNAPIIMMAERIADAIKGRRIATS